MAGRAEPAHGFPPRGAEGVAAGVTAQAGKYGRLFSQLDALNAAPEALAELGATMSETVSVSADNDGIPAAYTYLGQFIDHDLTFDATTIQERRVDPAAVWNFRTPAFDLDSLYGGGPAVQPMFYRRDNPAMFEIGCTQRFSDADSSMPVEGRQADLPRAFNRFALVADSRNDENLILSQLHLGFLHFHNAVVRWLMENGGGRREYPLRKSLFDEARDLVVRHYQWIVLDDFLPRIVHEDDRRGIAARMEDVGPDDIPFLPVEFSAAAFRFGHSMVRPEYNVQRHNSSAPLKALLARSGRSHSPGLPKRLPIREDWIVNWRRLLALDSTQDSVLSRIIDPYLAPELGVLQTPDGPKSLAAMNLLRGRMLRLPAGQSVASLLGVPALTPDEIASGPDGAVARRHGLDRETPLWYYVLKEAKIHRGGLCLGSVGGRIVAEVFARLLRSDPHSIVTRTPAWRPSLPSTVEGKFRLEDLLRFAGVLPDGDEIAPALARPCGRTILPASYDAF